MCVVYAYAQKSHLDNLLKEFSSNQMFWKKFSLRTWQNKKYRFITETKRIPAIEIFVVKFEQIFDSIILYTPDKSPWIGQSELEQAIINYYLKFHICTQNCHQKQIIPEDAFLV